MLKLTNISKNFQGKQVLDNVSVVINSGEKVALVGDNGAGKTTLFRIVMGLEKQDDGSVTKEKEVFGYLSQEPLKGITETVEMYLSSLGINMEDEHVIRKIFSRVKLDARVMTVPCSSLSEGQKTKVALASLLLQTPEVTALILDEPTNNLDLEGIVWLEHFVKHFKGMVFIVSHDRALLDGVVEKIIELKDGKCTLYGGNYSLYIEEKRKQAEAYKRHYDEQEKNIRKLEQSIKDLTVHARSIEAETIHFHYRKQAAKIVRRAVTQRSRIERILENEEHLEKPEEVRKYNAKLAGVAIKGKTVLEVKKISKSFEEHLVFSDLSFIIDGGERVWFSGRNGSGKSTLLNIIRGNLRADSGEVNLGPGIKTGYFSQEQRMYPSDMTVLEELQKDGTSTSEVHRQAKKFLLSREIMNTKMNTLSVGQQTKVEFLKLLSGSYQLLLLDEPTNHIEIQTRELIEEALRNYRGTLLVSSHDRYFLERIGIGRTISLD
ncbi:MAG: ABC-F family ATP-binding cassette domain-containing protein [Patescibacteria group bacterium]